MTKAPRATSDYVTFAVVDPDALAAVAEWVIEHKGGAWSEVPEELRKLQPTLSKLANAALPTVSSATLGTIMVQLRRASEDEHEQLVEQALNAIIPKNSDVAGLAYSRWLEARNAAYSATGLNARGPHFLASPAGPVAAELKDLAEAMNRLPAEKLKAVSLRTNIFGFSKSVEELPPIAEYRQRFLASIVEQIRGYPRCEALIESFRVWATEMKHEQRRITLALNRMAEPFAEAHEAGLVERRLGELSAAELESYVQASLTRERVLLKRKAGVLRMQEIFPIARPASKKSRRKR